jgi:hypothetical protein
MSVVEIRNEIKDSKAAIEKVVAAIESDHLYTLGCM